MGLSICCGQNAQEVLLLPHSNVPYTVLTLVTSESVAMRSSMSDYLLCTGQTYLLVMAPCMVAVAHPRTVEDVAVTAGLATSMSNSIMICMAMLAAAFQDPATLCRDEEEGLA